MAAAREHARLGTDFRDRIDIFQIIEKASIWLLFRPLRDLYGSFQVEDGVLGIIVNSNHPLQLQRFTAAHEYGHFVMGHEPSLDDAHNIESFSGDTQPPELAAQAFASNFMMPLQLVNRILSSMGVPSKPESLSPETAYAISLELGVSYPAAINQLAVLGKITRRAASELRALTPKAIKQRISNGLLPEDPRADVWLVGANGVSEMHPRVNDELHVNLPEIPSSGYRWAVDFDENPQTSFEPGEFLGEVALIHDSFETHSQNAVGSQGLHRFVLRAVEPGSCRLRLVKKRPWERSEQPRESFDLVLRIEPKSRGGTDPGLLESQKELLIIG